MRPPAQRAALVRQSISKFRRAIRLRPDFDRACYNLGTVIYAFACTQQSSMTQQLPSRLSQVRGPCRTEHSCPIGGPALRWVECMAWTLQPERWNQFLRAGKGGPLSLSFQGGNFQATPSLNIGFVQFPSSHNSTRGGTNVS